MQWAAVSIMLFLTKTPRPPFFSSVDRCILDSLLDFFCDHTSISFLPAHRAYMPFFASLSNFSPLIWRSLISQFVFLIRRSSRGKLILDRLPFRSTRLCRSPISSLSNFSASTIAPSVSLLLQKAASGIILPGVTLDRRRAYDRAL